MQALLVTLAVLVSVLVVVQCTLLCWLVYSMRNESENTANTNFARKADLQSIDRKSVV